MWNVYPHQALEYAATDGEMKSETTWWKKISLEPIENLAKFYSTFPAYK